MNSKDRRALRVLETYLEKKGWKVIATKQSSHRAALSPDGKSRVAIFMGPGYGWTRAQFRRHGLEIPR